MKVAELFQLCENTVEFNSEWLLLEVLLGSSVSMYVHGVEYKHKWIQPKSNSKGVGFVDPMHIELIRVVRAKTRIKILKTVRFLGGVVLEPGEQGYINLPKLDNYVSILNASDDIVKKLLNYFKHSPDHLGQQDVGKVILTVVSKLREMGFHAPELSIIEKSAKAMSKVSEGKIGKVQELTPRQQQQLITDFRSWSGGFDPQDCPWVGDKDEMSVSNYIEHSLPSNFPKEVATKFLKSLTEAEDAFRKALQVKCPLCKAEPGKGCISIASGWKKGQKLSTLHNERLRGAGFGAGKLEEKKTWPKAKTTWTPETLQQLGDELSRTEMIKSVLVRNNAIMFRRIADQFKAVLLPDGQLELYVTDPENGAKRKIRQNIRDLNDLVRAAVFVNDHGHHHPISKEQM